MLFLEVLHRCFGAHKSLDAVDMGNDLVRDRGLRCDALRRIAASLEECGLAPAARLLMHQSHGGIMRTTNIDFSVALLNT